MTTGSAPSKDEVYFNPFEDGFFQDPYPQYARLREHDPVHRSPLGVVVVTRYDDVRQVLYDPTLGADDRHVIDNPRSALLAESKVLIPPHGTMARLDPPDHTRVRSTAQKPFSPREVAELRNTVRVLVNELLDQCEEKGQIELVSDFARPLTLQILSDIIGIPPEDRLLFREQVNAIVATTDVFITAQHVEAAVKAVETLSDYYDRAIADKRANPGNDLLSSMIAAADDYDTLTNQELAYNAMLIYMAGHETTMYFLAMATLRLLEHDSQLELLRKGVVPDSRAIQELLRYDNVVHYSGRVTKGPYQLGGITLEPNSTIVTVIASANRDPRHWGPTADQLDLTRARAHEHISFGHGIHHCLGARLAALEAEIAIPALLRRFPELHLRADDPPQWASRLFIRELHLPLSLKG